MFKLFVIGLSFLLLTNFVTAQNPEKSQIVPRNTLIDQGPAAELKNYHKVEAVNNIIPSYITSTNSVGVSTGITGFWDYQTNGAPLDYIEVNPLNPDRIHAIMMIATDSGSTFYTNASRRTGYNYSSDGGATWSAVPSLLNFGSYPWSGYPAMAIEHMGEGEYVANIVNHAIYPTPLEPEDPLATTLSLQLSEGSNVFGDALYPSFDQFELYQPIWPSVKVAQNGNLVILAGRQSPHAGVYIMTYNRTGGFTSWTPLDTLEGASRSGLAVSPDGRIAAGWFASSGGIETYTIRFCESFDNGVTWTPIDSVTKVYDDYIYFGGFDMMYIGNNLYIATCGGKIIAGSVPLSSSKVMLWDKQSKQNRTVIDSLNFPQLKRTQIRTQQNHAFAFHQPSLGKSADDSKIYVVCSAHREGIIDARGYHYSDIIFTQSTAGGFSWSRVRNLTQTDSLDERYPSVSNFNPTISDSNRLYLVFQEENLPGANLPFGPEPFPPTRASLKFLKVNTDYIPKETHSINISNKWNMVSVPLNITGDKDILFPTSISKAYIYHPNSGYSVENILEPGKCYWLKFDRDQTVEFTDYPLNSIILSVSPGWNMIGSISYPVPVSTINANPSEIIVSPFYEYDNRYSIADTLKPGKGYWVKVNQQGTINLICPD